MNIIVTSYSEIHKPDSISFDEINAARMWYNRSMTSDIYKIEMYLEVDGEKELLMYKEK